MSDPKRIAFVGDVHGNLAWTEQAVKRAAELEADVIVQLGDYGYTYVESFVAGVERALRRANLELWFVDGNHDSPDELASWAIQRDGRRHLTGHVRHLPRGHRWTWSGVSFLALGGAYSIDRKWRTPKVSWWPEEEITNEQVSAAIGGGDPVDVLVSHDCPTGVVIPGLEADSPLWPPLDLIRANNHRVQLRRVTDAVKPRHIWHGHYHRRYETTADLGYGPVQVHGLDCDGTTLAANLHIVDLGQLLIGPS